jgi:PAS domain S-box-containing protein
MPGAPDGLYRAFFASAPVGCGISDERGKLLDFNDAMLRYSGWTRAEIERMGSVSELYYDGPAERDRLLGIARAHGRLDREEVRFRKKDGGSFWGLMSLRPVEADGRRYWLALVEDISERKRAEAEIARRIAELEQVTRMMVDRESKMIELKERIRKLEEAKDAP